jgi:hypothetical protein
MVSSSFLQSFLFVEIHFKVFKSGVANQNWSLGRKMEYVPKIWTFGLQCDKKLRKYTQNIEKSPILDLSLGRENFPWSVGRELATPVLYYYSLNYNFSTY